MSDRAHEPSGSDTRRTFADRNPPNGRPRGCPRCGGARSAEIIIQARPTPTRRKTLATRARGFCEPCALEVFEALEAELDR